MQIEQRKRLMDMVRMQESLFRSSARLLREQKEKPWWYVRASWNSKGQDWLDGDEYDWRNKLEMAMEKQGFAISDGHGQGSDGSIDVWWWTQDVDRLLNEVAAYINKNMRGLPVKFSTLLEAPRTQGPVGALPETYKTQYEKG